jgi:hypothetical protein
MVMKPKGKWAQGIQPRHFAWVLRDHLAVCERPGGYGVNHRRVRRQEEIIWLREQGFGLVISLIPSTHNLHNYDELGLPWKHVPFGPLDDPKLVLGALYPDLMAILVQGTKVVVHNETVDDRLAGTVGGFIRWAGMVDDGPAAVTMIERIVGRQLDPLGRALVSLGPQLPGARSAAR